jgi:hypothetical protein
MPLQNRVTPFGDIVATKHRGRFTGNRGIVHDPETRTLLKRRWTTKAWIACVCEFRGRRRQVMAMRSWTELFFLDEATAFAAGHRPCFYCRRADAEAFRDAWARGNGRARAAAPEIDAVLHAERIDGRGKRTHALDVSAQSLPNGAMIAAGADAFVIAHGAAWRWSFAGYQHASDAPSGARLLTPPSIVSAFRAGYRAQIDVSVGE